MQTILIIWAASATIWAVIMTILIFRNPLPFPDRGHRIFGVADEHARATVIKIIENLSGRRAQFTFDSGDIHQTVLADGYTSIHYIDNRPPDVPPSGLSIPVRDPMASAQKAIEMLQNEGYTASLIDKVETGLPPNHLVPVRSNAFQNWALVFRRPLLKMPRPKFR